MRLIDADAVIEKFNEKADIAECLIDARTAERFATFCALADAVEEAPTVDAEVVVRCKECKHKGWVQEPCHGKSVDYCKVWDCTLRDLESTFCSYGERRDGGS